MFALVDCNNFYVSCERVFRPDLNAKPVVVLSNNDGCVISRSNEAKAIGIPMGAPAFKYQQIFQQQQITVFSSNYALYGDMSNRVMNLLARTSPEIEVYSIDEAFLKFEGCASINFESYGANIRQKVTKSTGIPISIGVAPTKALAKVANRIAKKFEKRTNGVYVIDSEEKRIKALKWIKIQDVWGIGSGFANKLSKLGVKTAYQFTQQTDSWVRKHMSVVGLRLKKDLEGVPTLDLSYFGDKKNIATTRTFEENYTCFELIRERVSTFAVTCAEKLRKQQSNCNALMVFLRTNRHRKNLAQHNRNIVIRLPYSTNSNIELSKFATHALKQIYIKGYAYKKAGVIVMGITPANTQQISLFENSNPKHKPLMEVVDRLNQTLGQQKIKLGGQDLKRTWKMRQERLSPKYTTRLSDVILVKA